MSQPGGPSMGLVVTIDNDNQYVLIATDSTVINTTSMPLTGPFWLRGGLRGFRLHLAPVMAFEYPDEIIMKMESFGRLYPDNIIHPNIALLALHLWLDIEAHETRMREPFMASHRAVEPVGLEVFILYFSHYLRYSELMRHLHYMHPFRFAATAYEKDLRANGRFRIVDGFFDIKELTGLMMQVTSKAPGVALSSTIAFWPSEMPGSTMVPPSDMDTSRPSEESMALIGLGNVYQHGLPTYHHLQGDNVT